MLADLVLGADEVVSAEQLIDALWGEDLPDPEVGPPGVRLEAPLVTGSTASRLTPRATSSGPIAKRWTPGFEDLLDEARATARFG